MLAIQQAVTQDIDTISALYQELFADMAALQPEHYTAAQQSRAFIRNMILAADTGFFVARLSGEAVGFVLVEATETPDYNALLKRRYAYLMDIVVTRAHRSGGIGSRLMEAAWNWAAARGLEYLELQVLAQNIRAIRLYERFGFSGAKHIMHCPLPSSEI